MSGTAGGTGEWACAHENESGRHNGEEQSKAQDNGAAREERACLGWAIGRREGGRAHNPTPSGIMQPLSSDMSSDLHVSGSLPHDTGVVQSTVSGLKSVRPSEPRRLS